MNALYLALIVTSLFMGNNEFRAGNYNKAVEQYMRHKGTKEIYNAGNAYYRNKEYRKAISSWEKLLSGNTSPKMKFKSFYNSGNAFYNLGEYKKAEENYLNALNIKPYDEDARHNLELARKKIKEQEKQNKNQQNKKTENVQQDQKNSKEENIEHQAGEHNKSEQKENNSGNSPQKNEKSQEPLSRNEKNYLKQVEKAEEKYRKGYLRKASKNQDDLERQFRKNADPEGISSNEKDW